MGWDLDFCAELRTFRAPLPLMLTRALRLTFVQLCLVIVAHGAEPVVKPVPEPSGPTRTVAPRLGLPAPVAAQQQQDGVIHVRWTSLEGALRYQLTRTSSGEPARVMELPIGAPANYIDPDITQGRTYYYTVAGINRDGVLGLKASSSPVHAMLPRGGVPASGSGTQATLTARQEGPTLVVLRWTPLPDAFTTGGRIERLSLSPARPPQMVAQFEPRTSSYQDTNVPLEIEQVQYRLVIDGRAPLVSNPVTLARNTPNPSGPSDSGSSGGSTAPATAATPVGSASFTAATPLTVRVGATVNGSFGGMTRVISLNEAIARADPAGVITGVGRGSTHVVGLSGAGDSLRVVAVPVTVSQ